MSTFTPNEVAFAVGLMGGDRVVAVAWLDKLAAEGIDFAGAITDLIARREAGHTFDPRDEVHR